MSKKRKTELRKLVWKMNKTERATTSRIHDKNNIDNSCFAFQLRHFFSDDKKRELYIENHKSKSCKRGQTTFLITPSTLTNNTKDTLRYYSMSCSWQDFYSVDSNKLQVEGNECDKNIPTILTLAPGQSRTVEIKLLISQTIDASEIKFKIGFNLMKVSGTKNEFDFRELQKKENIIWSNTIPR
jgi:hypothetical protein